MKTNTKPHRVKVGELTYADLARDEETPVVLYGLGDFYELSDKDYFTNTYGRFEKGKTLPTNQRYNLVRKYCRFNRPPPCRHVRKIQSGCKKT